MRPVPERGWPHGKQPPEKEEASCQHETRDGAEESHPRRRLGFQGSRVRVKLARARAGRVWPTAGIVMLMSALLVPFAAIK